MGEDNKALIATKLDFARNSVSLKKPSTKAGKKVDLDKVVSALKDPYKNIELLQDVSMYLKLHSGVYSRIIGYFSNMLTYDCILYPFQLDGKKVQKDKLKKSYQEAAMYIERLNPKSTLTWIATRLFEVGEVYIYKIEDSEGVIFKEMPNEFCTIVSVQNNVCKYAIDLKKLSSNKEVLATMPMDIIKLVEKFNAGGISPELLIDNKWFELEDNAYAFNIISPFIPKGYPPFAYLFDALIHLMDLEELEYNNAKIDNLKIIHQKIPMDKEGNLLIDYSEAKQYHEATKVNLPQGIAITTNPLELQAVTLHRAGNQTTNHRNNAMNGVYDNSGVNSDLFNGNSTSEMGIASGLKADELVVANLINMFENFINYDLSKNKKTNAWRIKLLQVTHFSRDAKIKISRENLAFGGSRLEFLAHNGYTPLQAMNILASEQAIGIDELLVPQMTSHTMGSEGVTTTSNGSAGRPKKTTGEGVKTPKTTTEATS